MNLFIAFIPSLIDAFHSSKSYCVIPFALHTDALNRTVCWWKLEISGKDSPRANFKKKVCDPLVVLFLSAGAKPSTTGQNHSVVVLME